MKHRRSILFTLAAILLLTAFPAFLNADALVQTNPDGATPLPADTAPLDGEIPPLEGGAPYPYPIISYEPPAGPASPTAPDVPTIDVWYGTTQNFGQLGNPQTWINILGRVSGTPAVTSRGMKEEEMKQIGHWIVTEEDGRLIDPADFDCQKLRAKLSDIKAPAGYVPVVSNERLAGHPLSNGFDRRFLAERIKQVFPKAKILLTIREQNSVIMSNYMQYLKYG